MMRSVNPMNAVTEEAAAWHVRLPDATPETWMAFTAWLEASPWHADAYDSIALADSGLGEALAVSQPAQMMPVNDNVPGWRRHMGRIVPAMTALAAALVAAVVLDPMALRHDPYSVATARGETRTVTLDGGTTITLNGESRVVLDRRDARVATLTRGEAAFNVVHDAANPFTLTAGDATLRDVGTIFDVTNEGGRVKVAVAEGAVMYNPRREAVLLNAGTTLAQAGGKLTVGQIDTAAVASWRTGRLVYRDTPIGDVAADVTRSTGVYIDVAPDLAQRPFSGVIVVDKDASRMIERLRALLAVDARPKAGGWTFTSRERATS